MDKDTKEPRAGRGGRGGEKGGEERERDREGGCIHTAADVLRSWLFGRCLPVWRCNNLQVFGSGGEMWWERNRSQPVGDSWPTVWERMWHNLSKFCCMFLKKKVKKSHPATFVSFTIIFLWPDFCSKLAKRRFASRDDWLRWTMRWVTQGKAEGGTRRQRRWQIETWRPPVHKSESAVTPALPPPAQNTPPHLRAIGMHVLVTHAGEAIHKLGVQPL